MTERALVGANTMQAFNSMLIHMILLILKTFILQKNKKYIAEGS